jgi:hypothetical protein
MDFIRVGQQDGELLFERLKRAEILFVSNDINKMEIYVNIESDAQTEAERKSISERYKTELNEFISFAIPKLQFINLEEEEVDKLLNDKIEIQKGWADEFKMSGIYVGWGIETFNNKIEFSKADKDKFHLTWTCVTDDLNYYDEKAKKCKAEITATLNAIRFSTKKDFWAYEKDKMDGKK